VGGARQGSARKGGEEALTAERMRQVQKRYSDFIALDARLRAKYGNRKLDALLAKSRLPGENIFIFRNKVFMKLHAPVCPACMRGWRRALGWVSRVTRL
jgi:hypothetical protein